MACFHIQRLLPEVRALRASHNCSAAIGDGGEKSRSDFREGVRCAWAKPSLDAITTNSALIGSGSPATLPAPWARPMVFLEGAIFFGLTVSMITRSSRPDFRHTIRTTFVNTRFSDSTIETATKSNEWLAGKFHGGQNPSHGQSSRPRPSGEQSTPQTQLLRPLGWCGYTAEERR